MKRIITTIIAVVATVYIFAQAPQKMSYQAVIRNTSNTLVANQAVGMRVSILQGSPTGAVVYKETYSPNPQTNANGLLTIQIGSGTPVIGNFSSINWSAGPYFIKTETDPAGGTNYTITGTSQLLSVPYALLANNIGGSVPYMSVTGNTTTMDSALFVVRNNSGQIVFAVYNEGVRIYVDDGAKGTKGGFAIGGFGTSAYKGTNSQKYFFISKDSIRMYLDNSLIKKSKGGFAIGGFDKTKGFSSYLNVTPDSTRIFTADSLKGFGVGDITKGLPQNYLKITPSNYFIGHEAGRSNTTGKYNSFIGYKSGYYNTEGELNSFIGYYAGYYNTTGYNNVFIGDSSGYYSTEGILNIFLGNTTGLHNTTGFQNIFIGGAAGYTNDTGNRNIFIGTQAGTYNTSGYANVFMGNFAGKSNTTGFYNVFIGRAAGVLNTTGQTNVFVGMGSGWYNTTGSDNIFIGNEAGKNNVSGEKNVFIGYQAGQNETTSNKLYIANSNTSTPLIYGEFDKNILQINADVTILGRLKLLSGSSNIFLGDSAGYYNTTGGINTVLGYNAGYSNNTGARNVFIGSFSGYSNIGGNRNVFVGLSSGAANEDGNENTSVGAAASYSNISGNFNTAMGRSAGFSNTTGTGNIFLGYKAGYYELGSNRLYIQNSEADSGNALIYGEFDNKYLKLNALTSVRDALILEPRSTAPPSPVKGMMYFDSTDNKLKVYDGTGWRSLW